MFDSRKTWPLDFAKKRLNNDEIRQDHNDILSSSGIHFSAWQFQLCAIKWRCVPATAAYDRKENQDDDDS